MSSNHHITISIDTTTRMWVDNLLRRLEGLGRDRKRRIERPTRISRKPDSSHAPSPNIDDRCNEKH